jgi:hypothetical protein
LKDLLKIETKSTVSIPQLKMSEGQGTSNPKKEDTKKEDPKKKAEVPKVVPVADPILELKDMFAQFLISSKDNQLQNRIDIQELRDAFLELKKPDYQSPTRDDLSDTSLLNRPRGGRRSSMFFGMSQPLYSPLGPTTDSKPNIQVLQADIVYDKELKVSSLEGLQYLSRQLQLLSSKYPGREIKMAHMVSYNLRPHVLASWNSYRYRESVINGAESNEIMVEDWLSLTNSEVQAILVEAARPRTKELYSKELVLFLGKGIPQTPSISTDNFSTSFYAPLMKSLNDLLHLHDLMSLETSNHSVNVSKIPVPGYGTRDSPGQVALWLISLGTQKDSILQWLGKDELIKHKTMESAVKFIRARLMEGRAQSEARQDFDAKLTPIRYEDLRHTQGESYTRLQTSTSGRPPFVTPRKHDHRPNLSSLATINQQPSYTTDAELNDDEGHTPDEDIDADNSNTHDTIYDEEDSLLAINSDLNRSRSAVSDTYRGYCSELFVYGKCSRQNSGCTFDHSAVGQERCIQSFSLLTKRELQQHAQLEPWSRPIQTANAGKATNTYGAKHAGPPQRSGPVRPYAPSTLTRPYQK